MAGDGDRGSLAVGLRAGHHGGSLWLPCWPRAGTTSTYTLSLSPLGSFFSCWPPYTSTAHYDEFHDIFRSVWSLLEFDQKQQRVNGGRSRESGSQQSTTGLLN